LIAAGSKETAKASILAPLGLQLGNTEHLIPHQHIRIPPKDTSFLVRFSAALDLNALDKCAAEALPTGNGPAAETQVLTAER